MVLSLVILILCLFFSIFFSAAETAFTSLSLVQIQNLKSRSSKSASIIEEFFHRPEAFLSTILIGNNIANVSISVISSAITINVFGNIALGITTAIVTLVILIFGEILPKQLAIQNNEKICIHISGIIKFLSHLFFPIIKITIFVSTVFIKKNEQGASNRGAVTQDSILNLVSHAHNTGNIEEYESQIVKSIFRFSDITVHAVMTHRQKVFSLNQNLSVQESLPAIISNSFSRIPIFANNPENITGVVFAKQIFALSASGKNNVTLADIAKTPVYIPETWKINRTFHKLKNESLNIAIILDEYGGLAGIITMEDLVEEIIGDLYDEGEIPYEEMIHKSQKEGWYSVLGNAPIHLFEEIIGSEIEHDRNSETVGGYVIRHLSALPVKGQTINTEIGTFVIQAMTSKHVQNMLYKPLDEHREKLNGETR